MPLSTWIFAGSGTPRVLFRKFYYRYGHEAGAYGNANGVVCSIAGWVIKVGRTAMTRSNTSHPSTGAFGQDRHGRKQLARILLHSSLRISPHLPPGKAHAISTAIQWLEEARRIPMIPCGVFSCYIDWRRRSYFITYLR
jgi:hypothetical protein